MLRKKGVGEEPGGGGNGLRVSVYTQSAHERRRNASQAGVAGGGLGQSRAPTQLCWQPGRTGTPLCSVGTGRLPALTFCSFPAQGQIEVESETVFKLAALVLQVSCSLRVGAR